MHIFKQMHIFTRKGANSYLLNFKFLFAQFVSPFFSLTHHVHPICMVCHQRIVFSEANTCRKRMWLISSKHEKEKEESSDWSFSFSFVHTIENKRAYDRISWEYAKNTIVGARKKIKNTFVFRNKFKYHAHEYNERFNWDNIKKNCILAEFGVNL